MSKIKGLMNRNLGVTALAHKVKGHEAVYLEIIADSNEGYGITNIIVPRAELLAALGIQEPEPTPPTNQEVRDALPSGSVIRFNNEQGRWVKIGGKGWVSTRSGGTTLYESDTTYWEEPDWVQHVVYNPEED